MLIYNKLQATFFLLVSLYENQVLYLLKESFIDRIHSWSPINYSFVCVLRIFTGK